MVNSFSFISRKRSRLAAAIICLLTFHSVPAKSNPPPQPEPVKPKELILSLPEYDALATDKPNWSNSPPRSQNADNTLPLIIGGKKKPPVNVDCGMDVYQNSGPDISITSRLTGECDVKYRY